MISTFVCETQVNIWIQFKLTTPNWLNMGIYLKIKLFYIIEISMLLNWLSMRGATNEWGGSLSTNWTSLILLSLP